MAAAVLPSLDTGVKGASPRSHSSPDAFVTSRQYCWLYRRLRQVRESAREMHWRAAPPTWIALEEARGGGLAPGRRVDRVYLLPRASYHKGSLHATAQG